MKFILGISMIAAVLGPATAHSWVEEMQAIGESGNYTGDYGYARGYVARTDPGFNGDSMDYLLPPLASGRTRIDSTDLLCHPSQRTSGDYKNRAYPRLRVTAGQYVAMKYLENGHVTLPENQEGKPKSGGPVFVYSTTSPSDNEKIADVLKWNRNTTGGDKRGTLLASQNFDDGRCHQINSGSISVQRQQEFPDRVAGQPTSSVEQWCETDVQIPSTHKVGDKVTLYWVWSWPTEPKVDPTYPDGKDEYYTSCAEVEIVDKISSTTAVHTLVQQDPQNSAVSDFKSRTAYTSSPVYTLASGTVAGGTSSSSAISTITGSYYNSSPMASVTTGGSSSPVYPSVTPASSSFSAYPSDEPPSPPSASSVAVHSHTKPANSSSSGSANTTASAVQASSYGSGPDTITVTDFVTIDAQKKQVNTRTSFTTTYVTASPSADAAPNPAVSAAAAAVSAPAPTGAKFRY